MARSPLELYARLLESVGESASADGGAALTPAVERAAVTTLRRHLRDPAESWPRALTGVMADAGVSTGYVTRHLLSIARFTPDVRAALAAGLPLSVCRLVNGVEDAGARAAVLEPLWRAQRAAEAVGGSGPATAALLPRGLSQQIERAARRAAREPTGPTDISEPSPPPTGWLPAAAEPTSARRPRGNVWVYPTPSRAAKRAESLPVAAVEALLALYLPTGGKLVDVTAGNGSIGRWAAGFGVASWSGDVAPGSSSVHRADARELMATHGEVLAGAADMLVVHPPTYPAWLESLPGRERADAGLATVDGYTDLVADMLAGSLGALGPGGVAVVITRPVRAAGRVWLVTSHVSQVMEESDLKLVGYHLAVSQDEREEWQLLVGRREATSG